MNSSSKSCRVFKKRKMSFFFFLFLRCKKQNKTKHCRLRPSDECERWPVGLGTSCAMWCLPTPSSRDDGWGGNHPTVLYWPQYIFSFSSLIFMVFFFSLFSPFFFCCHFYSVYGTEREGTNDPPDFFFLCRVLRSSSSSSWSYLLLTTPASVQSEWENGTDIRPTFFLSLSLLLELLFIICKRLVGWVGSRGRSGTAHQVRHQMSFSFPFYTTAGVRRKPPANWLFQRLCRVCCDCRLYLSAPYNNNNTVARASFFFSFFSFSFFFKQSFRKSRCGKSYRARENDYLLHLTRPYWKKTKKLFSCRDFF